MIDADYLFALGHAAQEAGDYARARRIFETLTARGDASAWISLGLLHDYGHGVAMNKSEAMRCYRMAWRSRNTIAAVNIAILYKECGNWRAMFQWYRRAAETGDDGALVDMAKCYRDGVGVRRSDVEVVKCLRAALRGHSIFEDEQEIAREMLEDYRLREVAP